MNPFDNCNPAKPHVVVFGSNHRPAAEKVGQFLHSAGYHAHFNFAATLSKGSLGFKPGYLFQVFVPAGEAQAVREVLARYGNAELTN
jgi:hypothetical protein